MRDIFKLLKYIKNKNFIVSSNVILKGPGGTYLDFFFAFLVSFISIFMHKLLSSDKKTVNISKLHYLEQINSTSLWPSTRRVPLTTNLEKERK